MFDGFVMYKIAGVNETSYFIQDNTIDLWEIAQLVWLRVLICILWLVDINGSLPM